MVIIFKLPVLTSHVRMSSSNKSQALLISRNQFIKCFSFTCLEVIGFHIRQTSPISQIFNKEFSPSLLIRWSNNMPFSKF